MEQQREPDPHADAVDRREQRLVEHAEPVHERAESRIFSARAACHLAQILPRREGAAAAGHDDGVDGGVVLRVAERVAQLVPHLAVEGVPLLRAVQGEDEDGAVAFLENGLAHAADPIGRAVTLPRPRTRPISEG